MSLPYVCRTCRARLLPHLRTKPLAPPAASRSQTTTARNGRDDDQGGRVPDNHPFKPHAPSSTNTNGNGSGSIKGRYSGKELSPEELLTQLDQPWESRVAAAKPRPRKPTFNNRNPPQIPHPPGRQKETPIPTALAASSRSFIQHVNAEDFPRAWSTLQLLAQECEKESLAHVRALMRTPNFVPVMHIFIWACIRQWLASLPTETTSASLPAPREVFQALYAMRTAKPSFLRPALWQAASSICEAYAKGLSMVRLDYAIRELTEMWRLCMALQHGRNTWTGLDKTSTERVRSVQSTPSAANSTDWNFLPADASTLAPTQRPFAEVLNDFVPVGKKDLESKDPRRTDYASAALITLDLLRNTAQSADGERISSVGNSPECAPFMAFLESILNGTPKPRVPMGLQEKLASIEDEVLIQYYTGIVSRLGLDNTSQLSIETAVGGSTGTNKTANIPPLRKDHTRALDAEGELNENKFAQPVTSRVERFTIDNIKRLGRAVEQQDMYLVEKIRREVYAFAGTQDNDPTALPLDLYEHLMQTFLTLRNPKAAIEIWNHIIQIGYMPTVKTYTVMMRGAQASRDASGMEAFWQKMRNAGYPPDEHAWSIRVFGLLKLKLVKRGLQALNEMGQEWFAAAKAEAARDMGQSQQKQASTATHTASQMLSKYPGPIGDIPRPSLVVMNSAISALASTGEQEIPKVLTWGRSFGIDPDVVTYNVLLNIAMRHGQPDEAMNILRRMNERGVAADSTTWTVLLTALFHGGFLDGLDHTQQQDKVLNFITSLEAPESGIPGIDDKAYALIIDRLLKFHNNASGATAVLNHMTATGRTPSTHIYTILMSSYFQKEPKPDFLAIESLWKQLQAQNLGYGARLDNVFYDRMIEGYGTHHRHTGIQPALGFLKRARQAGQKPGWRALETVARALAERQDWNRLRALVDDVRINLREARGATQHMGQRSFWTFIIETGLLSEEGIDMPEQLLPADARRSPLVRAAEA